MHLVDAVRSAIAVRVRQVLAGLRATRLLLVDDVELLLHERGGQVRVEPRLVLWTVPPR